MRKESTQQPSKTQKELAKYLAMVVRNAMEDFHVQHLSDSQMMELNPIIRNAIVTGLHAFANYDSSEEARQYVDFTWRMIPTYWEEPKLLDSYQEIAASVQVEALR